MLEFVRIQKVFPVAVRRVSLPGPRFRAVHLSDFHLEDGFDERWLRRELKRFGISAAREAYLLVADRNGATYCAPMEAKR